MRNPLAMSTLTANDPTQLEKFHALLCGFDTAMLVTHSDDGELRARPMAIAKVDDNCRVWFLTLAESGKVHEIDVDKRVNVTCQRERDLFLSLTGRGDLDRDRAKLEELWKEEYKVWFPEGKDDPHLVLLAVEPEEGEYWDQEGMKKLKYLFESAKALATGTRPKIDEGEQHGRVRL